MKKQILVGGFAGLSMIAGAQSNGKSGQSANTGKAVSLREVASGQAPSKQAPAPKSKDREASTPSVSEVVVTKPSGNKTNAAAGDVNGGSQAQAAAPVDSSNGKANTQSTAGSSKGKGKSTQDAANGHPTGKRQHSPVVVVKQTDAASTKLSQ